VPIFPVSKSRRFKHAASRSIDWGNGITNGLAAAWKVENGASVIDSVRGVVLARTGSASVVTGPNGARSRVDATGACFRAVTPTHLRIQPPLTLIVSGRQVAAPATNAVIGGCTADDADNSPYVAWGFNNSASNYGFPSNNGSFAFMDSGFSVLDLGERWLAGTIAGGTRSLYVDSAATPVATGTLSGTISYSTNSSIGLGEAWASAGRNSNFDHDYMYVWNRALSAQELDSIRTNPYQIFIPLRRSTVITFGGTSGVTATYAATLGDTTFSGVAARTLPASAAGTYAATLGSLTASLTASFTAAPSRSGAYAATLGNLVTAATASFTAAPSRAGTYAATIGGTTLVAVASFTAAGSVAGTYSATLGNLTTAATASFTAAPSRSGAYAATLGDASLSASASTSSPGVTTLMVPIGRRNRRTDQGPPAVNSWHPLARHLQWIAAPGVSRIEATKGRNGLLLTSGVWAVDGDYGLALDSTSQTNGGAYWTSPQLSLGTSYTIGVLAKLDTLTAGAGQQKLLCIPYRNDATWTSPFAGLGFYAIATTGAWGAEYAQNSTTAVSRTGGSGFFDTSWHLYVAVRSGSNLTLYRDGVQHSTGTFGTNAAPDLVNGAAVHLGQRNFQNNGEGLDGKVALGFIMDKALTEFDVSMLADAPMDLLRSRRTLMPVVSGGVSGSFSATLGDTVNAATATFTAAPNRAATYAATLGDLTLTAVAARTVPPSRTATYAATLGNTVFAGVAARTLPGNVTATFAATLGSVVFAGVAVDSSSILRITRYASAITRVSADAGEAFTTRVTVDPAQGVTTRTNASPGKSTITGA
jgi:hypothetical protein